MRKSTYDNEYKDYIRKNQLETIFQKAFYYKIKNELSIQTNGRYQENVQETHGNALIQINVNNIELDENKFNIGVQLQGKTLKINLAANNYQNSNKDQIEKYIIKFKSIFMKNDFRKLNRPRTKAYVSVSPMCQDS